MLRFVQLSLFIEGILMYGFISIVTINGLLAYPKFGWLPCSLLLSVLKFGQLRSPFFGLSEIIGIGVEEAGAVGGLLEASGVLLRISKGRLDSTIVH